MKRITILLLLTILVNSSCEEDEIDSRVRKTIEDEIDTFEKQNIPIHLADFLENNEIVIFGETHYVQEHQEFISALLPELSKRGYRVIFDELFHCFNWMVEDYINGDIDELPEFILYFNETIIEAIRSFNSNVDDAQKFHLLYMDVNHWQSNFLTSVEEIEKVIGSQPLFSPIKKVSVDSDAYLSNLQNAKELLLSNNEQYISNWGTKWYERILEIISVEIESSKFRINRIDQDREELMFNNIVGYIQKNPNQKALVNTGMFHGQKATYMGNNIERIGQLLEQINNKTFSISFIGIKGKTKKRFDDENNISFNLVENASDDNIIKIINDIAHDKMSLTPLHNSLFVTQELKISYDTETTIEAPIGSQFDAIITYPQISTLKSMNKYDWRY